MLLRAARYAARCYMMRARRHDACAMLAPRLRRFLRDDAYAAIFHDVITFRRCLRRHDYATAPL